VGDCPPLWEATPSLTLRVPPNLERTVASLQVGPPRMLTGFRTPEGFPVVNVSLAVVGATGAVGELIRTVLAERGFRPSHVKFLASAKSAGKTVEFLGKQHPVEPLRPEAFAGVRIVLSSTPSSVSREWSPIAARAGAVVVDNSSAWRMDPQVPLVVPEVNPDALRDTPKGIVANPNCVAIPLCVALHPLRALADIRRVVVCTYQSSSGKGATGLTDFEAQLAASAAGRPVTPTAHKGQLAHNVLTLDWTLDPNGYTEEENKVANETRKILGLPDLGVSPTCVRVPVRVAHSEAVNVEFDRPVRRSPPTAARRRQRPHLRRPGAARPQPPARPQPVAGGGQPPQGGGHQRRPVRRGAGAARNGTRMNADEATADEDGSSPGFGLIRGL
jgi:aspartate-semialdehyde dehydrogenase